MTYDLKELKRIVEIKRKSFLTRFFGLILSTAAFVAVIAFSQNKTHILISGICIFATLILGERLFSKTSPKILFSKEIKGENIKEGEYEIMKRGSYTVTGLQHRQAGSRTIGTRSGAAPIAPKTRANRKAFHKNMHFSGELYLKQADGNIALLTGLYPTHLEIYEEGDVLLKPAGCKFPIVISRDAKRQPCPICGEVNADERNSCAGCSLTILK